MFRFIDHWIEKILTNRLHKNRDRLINTSLESFKKTNPNIYTPELVEMINHEVDRTFAVADRTIVRGKIKSAKYTFWITLITGIVLVAAISGFTFGAALPFISPVITALIAYILSLATIPISYNQEVRGHIDSIILDYEKSHSRSESESSESSRRIIRILEEHKNSRIVINILPAYEEEKTFEPGETIVFNQTTNLFKSGMTISQNMSVNMQKEPMTVSANQQVMTDDSEERSLSYAVNQNIESYPIEDPIRAGYRRLF
ncbi:MAG: hypothetical protein SFW66_05830 [Gammaproteobacteria bacterium]|nr:hypothetical protein [Gammaproteobacteria bacterium]